MDLPPSDPTPPQGAESSPVDLDYELIRLIGRGGYGEVWLVRDKEGNYRACKVVYRASFQNDRPYEREYEGIRKFEPVSRASESQVKILHIGRRDAAGCFYYIMELADDARGEAMRAETYVAKTLRSEFERRGRLPAAECIALGVALSAALENLHQHGLIHRDIKPANIIFVNGLPKLADIGLVTDADVTVSYVGTDGFIPPEGPSSPQADVYGLGKVLYEISTGKDRLEYPELPADFGELPDRELLLELSSIIAQACEADARKRYASASALRADLMLLQEGKSIRQIRSARKTRALAFRVAAAIGLCLLAALAVMYFLHRPAVGITAPSAKAAPPDPARVAEAEAAIKEKYRQQLAGGAVSAKQQAAAELVKQSGTAEEPAMQMAALRVAGQLAAEAGNLSLAMKVCDTMGVRFTTDKLPFQTDLLAQAGPFARGPGKYGELEQLCEETGFEALAADDYDTGTRAAELAKAYAHSSNERRRMKEAAFLDSEMIRCREAFEPVKHFKEVLRANPGNPAASLAMGKFLCFVKNDWEAGLLLMAYGTNDSFKSLAAAEINNPPKTADAQIALGDSWRNAMAAAADEDKTNYAERARYWYLKAVASSKTEDQERVRQQLNDFIHSIPTEPGEVHLYSRLIGTETIDIYSDETQWKSGRGAIDSRINHVKLEDLKSGDVTIIKNSGATRLMPSIVDFSSARLTVNHKPKRAGQSKATLAIAPDHVRVTLVHPGSSYAEVDVTVAFGAPP